MPSSSGFPSLATVVDRFRLPIFLINFDCRNDDLLSDLLDASVCLMSFSLLSLLLLLFIRKKFLNFVATWELGPCVCRFVDIEVPLKVRFSLDFWEAFSEAKVVEELLRI